MNTTMQPLQLIDKYYANHNQARQSLVTHSEQVATLASTVAEKISKTTIVDVEFVNQAAWLHDIGMLFTDAPALGCYGKKPYITHGILGAKLLRKENLPRHALVCERHIGVGLTRQDIQSQKLPLPLRDMCPQNIEEEIIAYADLFFSKTKTGQRTADEVRKSLARFDRQKVHLFDDWHRRFCL